MIGLSATGSAEAVHLLVRVAGESDPEPEEILHRVVALHALADRVLAHADVRQADIAPDPGCSPIGWCGGSPVDEDRAGSESEHRNRWFVVVENNLLIGRYYSFVLRFLFAFGVAFLFPVFLKDGVLTLLATQAMNLAFVGPLKHAGLALAIGLGACLNAGLLYRILRKQNIYTPQPGWPVFVLKVAASVGFMAVVLYTTMGEPGWWLAATWQLKVPAILGLVALGGAVYGACLLGFGFRPRDFSRRGAG